MGLRSETIEKQTGFFLDGENPFIDVVQENGNEIYLRKGIAQNSFFNDLGAQGGDVIKSINGTPIDLNSIREIIGKSFTWSPDMKIVMVVRRGDEEVALSGKAGTPTVMVETIVPIQSASSEQTELREAWLKG